MQISSYYSSTQKLIVVIPCWQKKVKYFFLIPVPPQNVDSVCLSVFNSISSLTLYMQEGFTIQGTLSSLALASLLPAVPSRALLHVQIHQDSGEILTFSLMMALLVPIPSPLNTTKILTGPLKWSNFYCALHSVCLWFILVTSAFNIFKHILFIRIMLAALTIKPQIVVAYTIKISFLGRNLMWEFLLSGQLFSMWRFRGPNSFPLVYFLRSPSPLLSGRRKGAGCKKATFPNHLYLDTHQLYSKSITRTELGLRPMEIQSLAGPFFPRNSSILQKTKSEIWDGDRILCHTLAHREHFTSKMYSQN